MIDFALLISVAAESAHGAAKASGGGPLTDPKWFVFYGLLAFFAVVYFTGAHKILLGALDKRAADIAKNLADAKAMREQAEKLLAEYQAKQTQAEAEAKRLVDQAKADADALRADAKRELEAELVRRERIAEERIARAAASAQADVKNAAAEAAIAAAERMLKSGMSPALQSDLVATGVKEMAAKLR